MPTEVIMPALGMAQETGRVVRWLRSEGEAVTKDEPLLEIETDKVTVEIQSPCTGVLSGLLASAGTEVPVGSVIGFVLAEGDETAESMTTSAAPIREQSSSALEGGPSPMRAARERRLASPKARRLADEHGVDLAALVGSGPNGAIVASDVLLAHSRPAETQPPNRVWQVMADRTQRSWQEVPHFFLIREVDASRLESWKQTARSRPGSEHVTISDLLVRVSAEALRRHPNVNAHWHNGTQVPMDDVNVAIAIAIDAGLVAPVVHRANLLSLAEIASRRRELVELASAGQLSPVDLQGGTFTVSNLGMFGVDAFHAIVNAPQAAILAVGRIAARAAVVDGALSVRPMLTITTSFDHRIVDGARGAAFLDTLASLIEEPAGLVA